MGDVFIWRMFNQIAIRPSVWGEKGDRDLVERTLKEDVPTVLDYLEAEAPADGFRFGSILSVADIAIAAFFRNAGWVRFQIDAGRWPRTAGWIGRVLATPAFAKLGKLEDGVLRVPIAEQRAALKTMGAPISAETYAGSAPRRGIMPSTPLASARPLISASLALSASLVATISLPQLMCGTPCSLAYA